MKSEQQRIAIAKVCGWEGCTDPKCDYRKAMHLHKNGVVAFPESYSIPRFPDYPNDLNAMHEAEMTLTNEQRFLLAIHLKEMTNRGQFWSCCEEEQWSLACYATAAQRAEAFLRTLNLWTDELQTPAS